jgi:diaminopropionate ammonia-lyase
VSNQQSVGYINPYLNDNPGHDQPKLKALNATGVREFHRALPDYAPTPLVRLDGMARKLGVAGIWLKDESQRFDLGAFKILGASYAVFQSVSEKYRAKAGKTLEIGAFMAGEFEEVTGSFTFCAATDGNHGRAVAWISRTIGQQVVIYIPGHSAQARVDNIAKEGARVVLVDGDYDTAVKRMASDAQENGWQIISDTGWQGYEKIPSWVMCGYHTLFDEIDEAFGAGDIPPYDFVILQAGVGAMAGAGVWYYNERFGANRPKLISFEPTGAACLMASAMAPSGKLTSCDGEVYSVMAGLNAGTPSSVAWPLLRDGIDYFMMTPDDYSARAMRALYYPTGDDPRVLSGESGCAGLAGLMALMESPELASDRDKLGIGKQSRIVLLSTEGVTDPENFERVVKE